MGSAGTAGKPSPRILVVDDDGATLEAYVRGLGLADYEVVAADGTEAGWREVSHHRPDAILLDLRMPPPDGFEFLRRLRDCAETRKIPVAIITGDYFIGDLESPLRLAELDATVYFKPISLAELTDIACKLLEARPPSR